MLCLPFFFISSFRDGVLCCLCEVLSTGTTLRRVANGLCGALSLTDAIIYDTQVLQSACRFDKAIDHTSRIKKLVKMRPNPRSLTNWIDGWRRYGDVPWN